MSDYVTRLFREALGRLEGEYRGEGLDAMALAARSLAADESKSYAAAHAVLDEGARLGERFDPFTYPALAMAVTDDAIRRGGITVGSDSIDIERQLVQGGPRSAEPKRSSTYPSALEHGGGLEVDDCRPRKMSPASLAKLARESATRNVPKPDIGMGAVVDRRR